MGENFNQYGQMFSIAILAGGFGKRLGQDKAQALVAGRPLLHWIAATMANLTNDLLVIRRSGQVLEPAHGITWQEIVDSQDNRGPLVAIETALSAARHNLVLVFACDMPLLDPALVQLLVRESFNFDVVIPVINGREEPLAAAYKVNCLETVRSVLALGKERPIAILPYLQVRRLDEGELRAVDPDLVSLTNVNYSDDLKSVERELMNRPEMR